jgi:hypothetical protein
MTNIKSPEKIKSNDELVLRTAVAYLQGRISFGRKYNNGKPVDGTTPQTLVYFSNEQADDYTKSMDVVLGKSPFYNRFKDSERIKLCRDIVKRCWSRGVLKSEKLKNEYPYSKFVNYLRDSYSKRDF